MGFWKSGRGINGDQWADEFHVLMDHLSDQTVANTHTYGSSPHEITLGELADLIEFCSRGHLIVTLHKEAHSDLPLSQLHAKGQETYSNQGQIHCQEVGHERL